MHLDLINFSPDQIKAFCLKHHIRSLAFFGSVLRSDFYPSSDVDVLVNFEDGHTPGYNFFSIEDELSRLIGHKVDLQTVDFLSSEFRKDVLDESVIAYEQT